MLIPKRIDHVWLCVVIVSSSNCEWASKCASWGCFTHPRSECSSLGFSSERFIRHPHGRHIWAPPSTLSHIHRALLLLILHFRNELQRAAKYSEAWEAVFGSVIHKLMAKTISTLSTSDLVGAPSFLLFRHAVFMDGFSEGWPGGRVLIFGSAGEELVSTLSTHIHAALKMIFINLPSRERTERHV